MSMAVDLSTPLTRAEREYLIMRGRTADIELADNLHGTTGDDYPDLLEGDGTGPDVRPTARSEVLMDRERQLRAELAQIEEAKRAAGLADEGEDEDLAPYEEWGTKELNAELKARDLPGGGSNADKAARLREDDARLEAEEAQRQQTEQ